ncbi:MAG: rhomboid family intramembrane serine protease [Psychrobacillus psychrotolerans]|uniref:rhomboid family intramembrane serine protease n=1 Tax=Psychrobacillus psychrotolerans TaxID=126156 RepID=UPI003BB17165
MISTKKFSMDNIKLYKTSFFLIILISLTTFPALIFIENIDKIHNAFGISKENIVSGKYWVTFTYSLFHRSYSHYLFNIILIIFMSKSIEGNYGSIRMVGLVLISIISSSISVILYSNFSSVIGASGIVFGMLGAYSSWVILYPTYFSREYKFLMVFILLINVLIHWIIFINTFNFSISSHIGGFIGGILFCFVNWLFERKRIRN